MTTLPNDALDRAERLCRTVAGPDLGDVPLYIVPQSALPAGQGREGSDYGFTTPSLDLYLQPHIPDWRGRGACMVMNDLAIRDDHRSRRYRVHQLATLRQVTVPESQREGKQIRKIFLDFRRK